MLSEPNVVNEFVPPITAKPGYNFGTANIAHGSVVCHDLAQSVAGDVLETARRQMLGVAYPAPANVRRVYGIYSSLENKVLRAGQGEPITIEGLAVARVFVPQSVSLPAGTGLTLASGWDATGNVAIFTKTIGSVTYSGLLEPVVWAKDEQEETLDYLVDPANPVAILREALTASGSANTVQMALVEVLGPHKPIPFFAQFSLVTSAVMTRALLRGLGPGLLTGVFAQMMVGGATSGATEIDVKINPVADWSGSPESISVFQTSKTILIPNDQTDAQAPVYGCGCAKDGDLDPAGGDAGVTWGTSERQGLLKAEANCLFPTRSIITAQILAVAGTPGTDVLISLHGVWL